LDLNAQLPKERILLSAGRERDFRRIILGLAEAHVHRLTRGVAPFGLSRQQFDTPG
jgi:hypothetical protein